MLPKDKACHTVPLRDGYVVVKVYYVHENLEPIPLNIPVPEADIFFGGMLVPCGSSVRNVVFSSRPLVGSLHRL